MGSKCSSSPATPYPLTSLPEPRNLRRGASPSQTGLRRHATPRSSSTTTVPSSTRLCGKLRPWKLMCAPILIGGLAVASGLVPYGLALAPPGKRKAARRRRARQTVCPMSLPTEQRSTRLVSCLFVECPAPYPHRCCCRLGSHERKDLSTGFIDWLSVRFHAAHLTIHFTSAFG